MSPADAPRAAEAAARQSYGRLLALLAARTRDIAAAEDALAEAFMAALRSWPEQGVPDKPDAWLMTVARHTLANAARHRAVAEAAAADLALLSDKAAPEPQAWPDERLKLLFVCAHPAIAPALHTPLMLQTVLGLDAARIGAALLVNGPTMGQRLVRAKARIRDAGLRFELPLAEDMPERLDGVLEAIYAAWGQHWDAVDGADAGLHALGDEALFLARLLVALLPQEPEPRGLLALMLYGHARRPARRSPGGDFVPLAQQDRRLWRHAQIAEAESLLAEAARAGRYGRFQCEAAIQSVHVHPALQGAPRHEALLTLYGLLAARSPSVGGQVAHAAVLLEAGRAADARGLLAALEPAAVAGYQPYWVVASRAAQACGDGAAAAAALQQALALTPDPATRRFLQALA